MVFAISSLLEGPCLFSTGADTFNEVLFRWDPGKYEAYIGLHMGSARVEIIAIQVLDELRWVVDIKAMLFRVAQTSTVHYLMPDFNDRSITCGVHLRASLFKTACVNLRAF